MNIRLQRLLCLGLVLAVLAPSVARADGDRRVYTISPNERIHVIQRKVDLLKNRLELTLYPISAQLNSRWTQHLGLGVAGAWYFTETFSLQALFGDNLYLAQETALQNELRQKAQEQPPSAPSILTQWYGMVSMEMSPIYGKIAYYKQALVHFSLFLTVGAGVVDTKVEILGPPPPGDASARGPIFASAGLRGAGLVGAGFRVHLTDNLLLRLEVRDLVYAARITKLNGCTRADLNELSGASPQVSSGCDVGAFDQKNLTTDAQLALGRTDGSSDTINQVSSYIGFSYLF